MHDPRSGASTTAHECLHEGSPHGPNSFRDFGCSVTMALSSKDVRIARYARPLLHCNTHVVYSDVHSLGGPAAVAILRKAMQLTGC
jgi:hypothetical protein